MNRLEPLTSDLREHHRLVTALANSLSQVHGTASPSPTDLLEALADCGIQLRVDRTDVAWRTYRRHLQDAHRPQLVVLT